MPDYQPSICVITPTIGRPTLRQTLESGTGLSQGDEWLIMADGPQPDAIVSLAGVKLACGVKFIESENKTGDYGNSLRDEAMSIATQDYFIFLDDDDVFAPNAIQIIKREIAEHHPRPLMFRMINGNGELLWGSRDITPGNIGGSMFCCPNTPGKLGTWANGAGHQSDLHFIEETLKLYGPGWRQNLFWSGDVIVHCRPHMVVARIENTRSRDDVFVKIEWQEIE
jgi:glycosyltransferase involved in cell wall biosynthesis